MKKKVLIGTFVIALVVLMTGLPFGLFDENKP